MDTIVLLGPLSKVKRFTTIMLTEFLENIIFDVFVISVLLAYMHMESVNRSVLAAICTYIGPEKKV